MRKGALYLVDRLLWASLVVAALVPLAPHSAQPKSVQAFSLSSFTPVVGEWRTPEGALVGTYTTGLGKLNDCSMRIADHEVRLDEIDDLVHRFATDPEMRADMMRHGITSEELDALARPFDTRTR